jgi:alcohol dehydrogenase class IV
MTLHQFSFPTLIYFGPGARKQAPDYLRRVGVNRPLIVTDKGLAAMKITTDFRADLSEGGLTPELFGGVWGNPAASQVRDGVQAFRSHQADAVIGFGGGAALDVAKAIALMATHEGDILDYAWDKPAGRKLTAPLPHFIALPTTAGTGSEVGRSAVISDDATHVKKIVFAPELLAKAVFADPQLTLGLPPAVTAATGMDALAHNVESYLSPVYHPLCDGIAVEGTRIAARALPKAVADGGDLTARADMLMASMMGAIAFQKDLGAVHSCGHALGTVLGLHHGLAIGVMFDHVMRFNAEVLNERFVDLARATGAGRSAAEFVNWLAQLKAEIGIPAKLSEVGVKPEHLTRLVELALNDTCHRTNPRPCRRDDFEALFRAAM